MERQDVLKAVVQLGRQFKRYDLKPHLLQLRVYFLAVRAGLIGPNQKLKAEWSWDQTVEWLRMLGLTSDVYARLPRGSLCPTCKANRMNESGGNARTVTTLPFGAKKACITCGSEWVELDR